MTKITKFYLVTQVSFFNNYLIDPKRPSLPEHPGNKTSGPSSGGPQGQQYSSPGSGYGGPPQGMMGYSSRGGGGPPMMRGGYGGSTLYQSSGGLRPPNLSLSFTAARVFTKNLSHFVIIDTQNYQIILYLIYQAARSVCTLWFILCC